MKQTQRVPKMTNAGEDSHCPTFGMGVEMILIFHQVKITLRFGAQQLMVTLIDILLEPLVWAKHNPLRV
jgi:hypothetical protein